MKLEDKYKAQLEELGVYQPAFDDEIHMLAMMDRELRREQQAWRKDQARIAELRKAEETGEKQNTAISALLKAVDAHYSLIMQMRRDILTHRDALGLTPKGLQRLRGKEGVPAGSSVPSAKTVSNALQALCDRVSGYE